MRRRTRDSIICHMGLAVIVTVALLCGWLVTKANGATTDAPPPAWTLLKQELGKDPNKADIVDLGKALRASLKARPDLIIPLVQTCASLACKLPYKRANLLVIVQLAVDARPDRLVECVDAAYAVCPDGVRGMEEKLVIATPEPESDLVPKWVPPEFPPMPIFSPVTGVQDVRRP